MNFCGVSLSILNVGIFNHDDLPTEWRSILEGEYEVTSSYRRNWESLYHISVVLGWNPYGPPYTLIFTKGHMLLRQEKGTGGVGEYINPDGSSTDECSFDEDYSLSGIE